jgi:hypothetical protein
MNRDRKSESDPHPNKPNHLNWEMFAIWSFVTVCFVALFAAGYVIWTKCHCK